MITELVNAVQSLRWVSLRMLFNTYKVKYVDIQVLLYSCHWAGSCTDFCRATSWIQCGMPGTPSICISSYLLLLHPFNGLFPGQPGYAGTRKVNYSGFYWSKRWWGGSASAGPYANDLHLAPERQYLTTQFLQSGCPSCRPTNSVKALKAYLAI